MIRVVLPSPLRALARVEGELVVDVGAGASVAAVLDVIETRYPALRGTIRDQTSGERRPFLRYFACEKDLSHDPPESALPERVADGSEPLLIVGAMAGG